MVQAQQVRVQAYTRVTLALDIVRRLDEGPCAGYHEINAIKHQIDLGDTLYLREAPKSTVVCTPSENVPVDETNICLRAVRLLQQKYGVKREVAIHITKRIPVMGGLAGGSADAAATLQGICALWGLALSREELMATGRQLGMDVPYFFVGRTALDREAGGDPVAVETSLAFAFVLVVPAFGVPTREAYAGLDYQRLNRRSVLTEIMLRALRNGDWETVARTVHNDFAFTVYQRYPFLQHVEHELRAAGCMAAWMSGSGSTMVGLARNADEAGQIASRLRGRPGIRQVLCARTLETRNSLLTDNVVTM